MGVKRVYKISRWDRLLKNLRFRSCLLPYLWIERFVKAKHSSLSVRSVSGKEKKFYDIDSRSWRWSTLTKFMSKNRQRKRERKQNFKILTKFSETINIKTILQLRKRCYETNQTNLIRRSTVQSLTLQLAFPDLTRESSLKKRAQYDWYPLLTSFDQLLLNLKNMFPLLPNKLSWQGGQLYSAFPFSKGSLA